MGKMLSALTEKRAALAAEASALLDGEPTAEALETIEARQGEIATLDAQIKSVEETEARAAAIAESRESAHISPAVVTSEPNTYSEHGNRSYFADLAAATVRNDRDAWDRLHRHMGEVRVESRAVDRTDGGIGEFVPPLWLVDQYSAFLRPGRVVADMVTKMALPGGTDSISIPAFSTQGWDAGIQTADGTATTTQDAVTTSITAPVRTIAGYAVVSQQLLDQSPLRSGIDQLVYADLAAAADLALEKQVLQGTGLSGQMTGIIANTGIGSVVSSGTATVGSLGTAVAQAISTVAKARYEGAEAVVMHPSLWYALVGSQDSSGRPIVVPTGNGPFNALGVNENPGGAQRFVGTMHGLPVALDSALATVSSAYPILVGKFSDVLLMESGPRTRVVIGDTTARQLQLNFQLYSYTAMAVRYPAGFCKVLGQLSPSGF